MRWGTLRGYCPVETKRRENKGRGQQSTQSRQVIIGKCVLNISVTGQSSLCGVAGGRSRGGEAWRSECRPSHHGVSRGPFSSALTLPIPDWSSRGKLSWVMFLYMFSLRHCLSKYGPQNWMPHSHLPGHGQEGWTMIPDSNTSITGWSLNGVYC